MLKNKAQRKLKENKDDIYVTLLLAALVGSGFILGRRYQRVLNAKQLKDTITLTKAIKPMFPNTMPISEIKEILCLIEGAEFFDALITNVNGVQSIIVR